jgi:hypothetical protein
MQSSPRAFQTREALLTHVNERHDLRDQLAALTNRRVATLRRHLDVHLSEDELVDEQDEAIRFGVLHALACRFAAERGHTAAWWAEQRRARGLHARSRRRDIDIVAEQYPEFVTYVTALSDQEIVEAARLQLRLQIVDKIVVPHENIETALHVEQHASTAAARHSHGKLAISRGVGHGQRSFTVPETIDAVDDAQQGRVENFLAVRALDDPANPFGPALTRLLSIALREVGPVGLVWVVEFAFFPKQYVEVLRFLGVDRAVIGDTQWWAMKRDMQRKLPKIAAHVLPIARQDPLLTALFEHLVGTPGQAPAPAPQVQELRSDDRTRILARQRARLAAGLRNDARLAPIAATVLAEEEAAGTAMTPTLERFLETERDPMRWRTFRTTLLRQYAPQMKAA